MATAAHPIPAPPPHQGMAALHPAPPAQSALVPAPGRSPAAAAIGPESAVARLPVEVEVGVPVRGFRVRNLLALEPGVVVASQWNHGDDLPLAAGDVKLAWTEFEVVETNLAARLTRLA